MSDNVRDCQAVGDFLSRLLAREFPGVQAAFICVSADEGSPEKTAPAPAAATEAEVPETPPPG